MGRKLISEELIDLVMVDLINGEARSQILTKLQDGLYDGYDYTKNISRTARYNIVKAAFDNCKLELKEKKEEQIALMYARYLNIYNDSIQNSDRGNARGVLDSLSKLMGLNEPDKIDVKGNVEVIIDFNLNETEENIDEEEEED